MRLVTQVLRAICRRRVLATAYTVVGTCVVLAGCGSRRTPPPAQSINAEPAGADAGAATSQYDSLAAQAGRESNDSDPALPDTLAGTDNAMVDRSQLATVGPQDARRGSTITGGGIITEPLKQYFQIQHRLVYINIQHAEQLYKGEHGRMPRTHDEYMQEIIERNEIALPELDAGWDYYYDAESEELMRRRTN